MAVHFEIRHTTTYKYANPVRFGTHKAMFLPRPAVRGRLLSWSARTNPPAKIRWVSDPLADNITVMEFSEPGPELVFTFQFRAVHYGGRAVEEFPLEPRAEDVPVQYTPDEWTDLEVFMRPHADDHDSSVAAWAKSFISDNRNRTTDVLKRMLDTFHDAFSYNAREAQGTQPPGETLRAKSGTCRDYAWLMIKALRRLGFAARFVSGYLYDAALDGGAADIVDSGATHAWVQVFLPAPDGCITIQPTASPRATI